MERVSMWPAVLGIAIAMIIVVLVEPLPHSLAYASGVVVLLSLFGWVREAREVAGPPPEVEPEEEEEEAPGPSAWPVVLALGIVGIAVGLIYKGSFFGIDGFWDYGALIIAIPLALGSALAWSSVLEKELRAGFNYLATAILFSLLSTVIGVIGVAVGLLASWDFGIAIILASFTPIVGIGVVVTTAWLFVLRDEPLPATQAEPALVVSGGRVLMPAEPATLVAEAAGGAAIALERAPATQVSRRSMIQITFWAGLGAGLLAMAGSIVDFLYPRGIVGFGGVVTAGTVDQFPPGSKTQVPAGKFWLVNLTEEQGGPGYLALWWKCPHLGCTVPWREGFSFVDPATNASTRGWFRCPCHGSTYNHAGVRVFGPAPRSMDRMEISIDPATGRIDVNTGSISKGTPDNANFVVQA